MSEQALIFVINMQKDGDRMESVARQLTDQGLQFERVEAVVGRDLSQEQRNAVYSPFWFGLLQGRRISDGEIGCALSHRKIYQMMIDRGQDCAVILEDDVKLMPQFARDLRKIEVETREFDMVHLFAFRDADTFHHAARGFNVMTYAGPSSSAAAYLLRHSGAKKLMSLPNIRVAADKWVWLAALTGLKRCGVQPYPVELDEGFSGASTIASPAAQTRDNSVLWSIFALPCLRLARRIVLTARNI